MKSFGGRLRGQKKAMQENLWDGIKSKAENILLLYCWVQDN